MMDITKEDLERLSLEELKRIENTLDNYLAKARASNITIDKDPFITSYKKALLQFHDTQSRKVVKILELVLGKEPSRDLALTEEQVSNIQIQLNMLYPQWKTDFLKFKERYTREMYRQIRSIQSERVKGVLEAENPELKKAKTTAGFSLGGPDERVLRVLGNGYIFPSCPNTVNHFGTLMEPVLRQGLENNKSVWQVSQDMRDVVTSEGPNFPDYWYDRISRTETALLTSQGQQVTMDENEISWYDWITGPGPCSGECEEMHQNGPYRVGEGPLPVQDTHPNCLCDISPITPFDRPDLYGGETPPPLIEETDEWGLTAQEREEREEWNNKMESLAQEYNLEYMKVYGQWGLEIEQIGNIDLGEARQYLSREAATTREVQYDRFLDRANNINIKIPHDLQIIDIDGKYHLSRRQFLEMYYNTPDLFKKALDGGTVYYSDAGSVKGEMGHYDKSTNTIRIYGNEITPDGHQSVAVCFHHEMGHALDNNWLGIKGEYFSQIAAGPWQQAAVEDARWQRLEENGGKEVYPGTFEYTSERQKYQNKEVGNLASRYGTNFFESFGRFSEDMADSVRIMLMDDDEVIRVKVGTGKNRKDVWMTRREWGQKYPNRVALLIDIFQYPDKYHNIPLEEIRKIKIADIPGAKIRPWMQEAAFDPIKLAHEIKGVQYGGSGPTTGEKGDWFILRTDEGTDIYIDPQAAKPSLYRGENIKKTIEAYLNSEAQLRLQTKVLKIRIVPEEGLSPLTRNPIQSESKYNYEGEFGEVTLNLHSKFSEKDIQKAMWHELAVNFSNYLGKDFTKELDSLWSAAAEADGELNSGEYRGKMATMFAERGKTLGRGTVEDFVGSLGVFLQKDYFSVYGEQIKTGTGAFLTMDEWRAKFPNRFKLMQEIFKDPTLFKTRFLKPDLPKGYQVKYEVKMIHYPDSVLVRRYEPIQAYYGDPVIFEPVIRTKYMEENSPYVPFLVADIRKMPDLLRERVKFIEISPIPDPSNAKLSEYYGHKFESGASMGTHTMTIYSSYDPGTLAHELAHGLDRLLSDSGGRFCNDALLGKIPGDGTTIMTWKDAFRADGGEKHFPTNYAKEKYMASKAKEGEGDLVEDFAESVERYMENPRKLMEDLPARYDILDHIFHPERYIVKPPAIVTAPGKFIDLSNWEGIARKEKWTPAEFNEAWNKTLARERAWGLDRFEQIYREQITQHERDVLNRWQGGWDQEKVNRYLKKLTDPQFETPEDVEKWRETIHTMDSAMGKSKLKDNINLYKMWSLEMQDKFQTMNVGDFFVEEGYLDANPDGYRVKQHADQEVAAWKTVLEVPKDIQGIHFTTLNLTDSYHEALPGGVGQLRFPEDRQILLQRNLKLTVKEINKAERFIKFKVEVANPKDLVMDPKVIAERTHTQYKGLRQVKEQSPIVRGKTVTVKEYVFYNAPTKTTIYIPENWNETDTGVTPEHFISTIRRQPDALQQNVKEIYWSTRKDINLDVGEYAKTRGDKVFVYLQGHHPGEFKAAARPLNEIISHSLAHTLARNLGIDVENVSFADQSLWKKAIKKDENLNGSKYLASEDADRYYSFNKSYLEDFIESVVAVTADPGYLVSNADVTLLNRDEWMERFPNRTQLVRDILGRPEYYKNNPLGEGIALKYNLKYAGNAVHMNIYHDEVNTTTLRISEDLKETKKVTRENFFKAYNSQPESLKKFAGNVDLIFGSSESGQGEVGSNVKSFENIRIYSDALNKKDSITSMKGVLSHELGHSLADNLATEKGARFADTDGWIYKEAVKADNAKNGTTLYSSSYGKWFLENHGSLNEDLAESIRAVYGMEEGEKIRIIAKVHGKDQAVLLSQKEWLTLFPNRAKAVKMIVEHPEKYTTGYEGEKGGWKPEGRPKKTTPTIPTKPPVNIKEMNAWLKTEQVTGLEPVKVIKAKNFEADKPETFLVFHDNKFNTDLYVPNRGVNGDYGAWEKENIHKFLEGYQKAPDILKFTPDKIFLTEEPPKGGSRMGDVLGRSNNEGKALNIYLKTLLAHKDADIDATLKHELAHQLDKRLVSGSGFKMYWSDFKGDWEKAVKADFKHAKVQDKYVLERRTMASNYSSNYYDSFKSYIEDWAESVMARTLGPNEKIFTPDGYRTKEQWAADHPNRTKLVDSVLKNPEKYLMPKDREEYTQLLNQPETQKEPPAPPEKPKKIPEIDQRMIPIELPDNYKHFINQFRADWYADNHFIDTYAQTLTEQEAAAVRNYRTHSKADEVNRLLREGKPLNASQKKYVETLNSALLKNGAPENMVVFRGVKKGQAKLPTPGEPFTWKEFTSTSLNVGDAAEFAGAMKGEEGGTLYVINVPKGYKGIQYESAEQLASNYKFYKDHEAPRGDYHEFENEWILPKDSEFFAYKIQENAETAWGKMNIVQLWYKGTEVPLAVKPVKELKPEQLAKEFGMTYKGKKTDHIESPVAAAIREMGSDKSPEEIMAEIPKTTYKEFQDKNNKVNIYIPSNEEIKNSPYNSAQKVIGEYNALPHWLKNNSAIENIYFTPSQLPSTDAGVTVGKSIWISLNKLEPKKNVPDAKSLRSILTHELAHGWDKTRLKKGKYADSPEWVKAMKADEKYGWKDSSSYANTTRRLKLRSDNAEDFADAVSAANMEDGELISMDRKLGEHITFTRDEWIKHFPNRYELILKYEQENGQKVVKEVVDTPKKKVTYDKLTREELNDWAEKAHPEYKEKFEGGYTTGGPASSLFAFKTEMYEWINPYLDGRYEDIPGGNPEVKIKQYDGKEFTQYKEVADQRVASLDAAFKNEKLGRNITVYSGVLREVIGEKQAGDIFKLSQFRSTSVNKKVAQKFGKGSDHVLLEIRLPEDASAIAVEPALKHFDPYRQQAATFVQGEAEIMLNRDSWFKVEKVGGRGGKNIILTYLGQGEKPSKIQTVEKVVTSGEKVPLASSKGNFSITKEDLEHARDYAKYEYEKSLERLKKDQADIQDYEINGFRPEPSTWGGLEVGVWDKFGLDSAKKRVAAGPKAMTADRVKSYITNDLMKQKVGIYIPGELDNTKEFDPWIDRVTLEATGDLPDEARVSGYPMTKDGHVDVSKLTYEQFRNWEFNTEGGQSWNPKEAMDYRESGGMAEDEADTLASVIKRKDKDFTEEMLGKYFDAIPNTLNKLSEFRDAIAADKPITVYRASDTGGIIPGSFVTESKAYAQFHGENYIPGKKWKIYEEKVFPDELMTYGDPHEFLYIPRTAKMAYQRVRDITVNDAIIPKIVEEAPKEIPKAIEDHDELIRTMNEWSKQLNPTTKETTILNKYIHGNYLTHISSDYPKGMEFAVANPDKFTDFLRRIDKVDPEIETDHALLVLKNDINYLRKVYRQSDMTIEDVAAKYLQEYKELDKVIRNQSFPEDVVVFRGNGKHGEELARGGVGSVIHLTNINSGSLDYWHSLMFEDSPDQPESGQPWIQGIILKKGDPVLQSEAFIQAGKKVTQENIAAWTKEFKERGYDKNQIELAIKQRSEITRPGESEILFPLGTQFKIIKIDKKNSIFYTEPIYSPRSPKPSIPNQPKVVDKVKVEPKISAPARIKENLGFSSSSAHPLDYVDENDIRWHVKGTRKSEAYFNQAGLNISQKLGMETPEKTVVMSSKEVKTKLPDVWKSMNSLRDIDTPYIEFTTHIDGSKTLLEFAMGRKTPGGIHQPVSTPEGWNAVTRLQPWKKQLDKAFIKDVLIGNADGHLNNYMIADDKIYDIDDGLSGMGTSVRNDWMSATIFKAVYDGNLPRYDMFGWEEVLTAWMEENLGEYLDEIEDMNLNEILPAEGNIIEPGADLSLNDLIKRNQADLRSNVLKVLRNYYLNTEGRMALEDEFE